MEAERERRGDHLELVERKEGEGTKQTWGNDPFTQVSSRFPLCTFVFKMISLRYHKKQNRTMS